MDTTPAPVEPLGLLARDGMANLFAREHRPMLRMATLMVGSPAVAEEIVQDAFVTVGARWSSLDKPGAYLRKTVVNGCAQTLRRRGAESRALAARPPEVDMELPTRLIELRHALDHLSDRQRLVVVLRYFVDLSDNDIADVLGVRPATVRSLAHRAFEVLRKELE